MNPLAKAAIDGPEAKGQVQVVLKEDGQYELQLMDFWVAPGAPDVRIVLSPNAEGKIDESMIEIGSLPDGNFETKMPITGVENFKEMKTVIVYCKKFYVHFGHGTLKP